MCANQGNPAEGLTRRELERERALRIEAETELGALKMALRESQALSKKEALHQVKNVMNVVAGLLALPLHKIKDRDAFALFQEGIARVHAMAFIYDALYGAKDLANINAGLLLRALFSHLAQQSQPNVQNAITLEVEADNLVLDLDRAVPFGMIVNELVTSAQGDAYNNRAGAVRVSLRDQGGGRAVLAVAAAGGNQSGSAGYLADGSLSSQIVEALVDQIDGSHRWSNGRSILTIEFPSARVQSKDI